MEPSMRTATLALCLSIAAPAISHAAERLVVAPIPGPPWKLAFQQAAGEELLHEHIPADQALETYKEMLSIRRAPRAPGLAPATVLRGVFGGLSGACGNVRVNGPVERQEGGRPVAYGQAYCNRQVGQEYGVYMFFKVIDGPDHFYLINHDIRVPPSEVAGVTEFPKGQEAEARAFMAKTAGADEHLLSGVVLCTGGDQPALCAAPPQGSDIIQ
jgi:hypothetical protein